MTHALHRSEEISINFYAVADPGGLRASLKQQSDSQELCANLDLYRAIEVLNFKTERR